METAGKGWEREGSSVPGGHLFTIISERSERAIDHSEVNQGMRVDRLHGVLSALRSSPSRGSLPSLRAARTERERHGTVSERNE